LDACTDLSKTRSLLQNSDGMSFPGQCNGGGETTQSGTDHDYFEFERLKVGTIELWSGIDDAVAADFVRAVGTRSTISVWRAIRLRSVVDSVVLIVGSCNVRVAEMFYEIKASCRV
jgi:hypothetical protein